MKKFYAFLLLMIVMPWGISQAQTWNFTEDSLKFEIGNYLSDTTIEGLTIYAASDRKVSIDTNGKSIDGYEFKRNPH